MKTIIIIILILSVAFIVLATPITEQVFFEDCNGLLYGIADQWTGGGWVNNSGWCRSTLPGRPHAMETRHPLSMYYYQSTTNVTLASAPYFSYTAGCSVHTMTFKIEVENTTSGWQTVYTKTWTAPIVGVLNLVRVDLYPLVGFDEDVAIKASHTASCSGFLCSCTAIIDVGGYDITGDLDTCVDRDLNPYNLRYENNCSIPKVDLDNRTLNATAKVDYGWVNMTGQHNFTNFIYKRFTTLPFQGLTYNWGRP